MAVDERGDMITGHSTTSLLFLFLFIFSFHALTVTHALTSPPFSNASNFPDSTNIHRHRGDNTILQDVLKTITARQRWEFESVRVLNLGSMKTRLGVAQRYELRVRVGKSHLVASFSDKAPSWKEFTIPHRDFSSFVDELSSFAVLDCFKIEGPFDLRVTRDGDTLSLLLPANTSFMGLKRVIVGEGITVEVRGAQQVSLFLTSILDLLDNRTASVNKEKGHFWPFEYSCKPLLPVHIEGSASLTAYRARRSVVHVETKFMSNDTIELLPEKCHISHNHRKSVCPVDSLSASIALLDKRLRNLFGERYHQNGFLGFLKAKIKASTVISFHLELERDVGINDTLHPMLAEWRTRPTIERVWFEILARVERVEETKLEPIMVKRVRPFIEVDTTAWSNLLSNVSFTKFPSMLVPPEALTLDVKW